MKNVIFLGAPEKSHLLLSVGKLVASAGKRVLLVDSSITQSVQAYLPVSDERPGAFVTEFAGIDVAAGFITRGQLEHYFRETEGGWPDYDVLLLDTDHTQFVSGQDLADFTHRVWCSNFNKLTLQKNVELLQRLSLGESREQPLPFFKLLLPFVETTISPAYIDSLYAGNPIQWQEPPFQISLNEQDLSAILDNQHHTRIAVRHLSRTYVQTVWSLASTLFDLDQRTIRAAWKQMRRRDRHGQ
ncbi:hypothetical protein HYD27_07865 [Paenibacillus sp. S150]|nr:hypothetical protein [Paenibacillus sp. S150]